MFALVSVDLDPLRINLKCDPADAQALRYQFESIQPGYHMNKEHWNSVYLDGDLEVDFVKELIVNSYQLVLNNLSVSTRNSLDD